MDLVGNSPTPQLEGKVFDFMRSLTISETTEILNVSRQTLMKWLDTGKIKGHKTGDNTSAWLIEPEEVERVRLERIAEIKGELEKLSISAYDVI